MMDYFFKNVDVDECIFIYKGIGWLKIMYGVVEFEYGDYVVVLRGIVYQFEFDQEDNCFFIVEFYSFIIMFKCYCNDYG